MTSTVSPTRATISQRAESNAAPRTKTSTRSTRTFQRTPLATVNLAKPLPEFPPRDNLFKVSTPAQSPPSPEVTRQPSKKSTLREPAHSHRKGLSLDSSVYHHQEPLYTVDEQEQSSTSATATSNFPSSPPPTRRRPPRERHPNHPPSITEVIQEEEPKDVDVFSLPIPVPPPTRPTGLQKLKNVFKRITKMIRSKMQGPRPSPQNHGDSTVLTPHMVEMPPQLARMSFASDKTNGTLTRYINRREAMTERLQASYLRVKGMSISNYEQRGSWVKEDFVCPFPDCEAHHQRPRPTLGSLSNRPVSDSRTMMRRHLSAAY